MPSKWHINDWNREMRFTLQPKVGAFYTAQLDTVYLMPADPLVLLAEQLDAIAVARRPTTFMLELVIRTLPQEVLTLADLAREVLSVPIPPTQGRRAAQYLPRILSLVLIGASVLRLPERLYLHLVQVGGTLVSSDLSPDLHLTTGAEDLALRLPPQTMLDDIVRVPPCVEVIVPLPLGRRQLLTTLLDRDLWGGACEAAYTLSAVCNDSLSLSVCVCASDHAHKLRRSD